MGYMLHRTKRSPARNLRRIAGDHLDASLAILDQDEIDAAALHELRTNIKKLRALVRLCAGAFPGHRAVDRTLRDAGRAIAALRDQDALTGLFDQLAALPGPDLPGLGALRAAYTLRFAAHRVDRAAALARHRDALRALKGQTGAWTLDAKGFAAIEPGLAKTYTQARKRMKPALGHPRGALLHDWRKRVKDHGFHARLLEPIWPEVMKAHISALSDLGDLLGDARDCAILAEHLDTLPGGADLAIRARARETERLAKAAPLARRVFTDDARRLTRRWRRWWKLAKTGERAAEEDSDSQGPGQGPVDQPDSLLHAV